MLKQKVQRTIDQYGMLVSGSGVVVAVSGGPDSVCLLSVLAGLAGDRGLRLHIAHLDHCFRGAESAAEARFVENLSRSLGIAATIGQIDVPRYCAERGLAAPAGAREVRYQFLDQIADSVKADRIALGHTANDQAETVMLRLIRGAGLAGLSGIRPARGRIIRPLIDVTRAEVLAYLREQGLDFVTDPSNEKPVCARNRLRREVLPVLERFNPRIVSTLAGQAQLFRDEDQALEAGLADLFPRTVREAGNGLQIDRTAFFTMPDALQKRLLRKAAEGAGLAGTALSAVQTDEAVAFMRTTRSGRRLDLPGGLVLEREYGWFVLQRRNTVSPVDLPLALSGTTEVPALGVAVEMTVAGPSAGTPQEGNYLWQAVFDYDNITLPLRVRNRRPGDAFQPAGMGGRSKKLQDYFVDCKVPRMQRDLVPILASGKDIVWVVGHRIDGRFLAGPGTKKALVVTIRKLQ
jgi:tRNA(Ile)-lysidine synthase